MNTKLYAATALLLASAAAPSGATVYNVARNIGSGGVTGTITTDDTLGVLEASNITDFSLTLKDAKGTRTITKTAKGSSIYVDGNAFSATSSGLFFDFGASGDNDLFLSNSGPQAFYCVQTNGCFDFDGAGEAVTTDWQSNTTVSRESGIAQIASATAGAVPEPATWGMMILGFGAVGAAMRRHKVASSVRYA